MTPSHLPRLTRSFLGLAAVLLVTPLPAQVAEGDAAKARPDVTVMNAFTITGERAVGWNSQSTFSGSRTATNLLETPQNISVLTAEFLKDTGATNLIDVLAYGASGVTQRVDFREDLMIRGFRTSPLRDGLTFTSFASITPLWDIDRIEVVKGPTAIVYSNYTTLSGTMNYVTKRPTTIPQGEVAVTAGNFATYGVSATQSGPVTKDKRLAYRATAGFEQMGGFIGREFSNYRMVSLGLDWVVSSRFQLRFDGGALYELNHDFGRALIDPKTLKLSAFSAGLNSSGADFAYVRNTSNRWRAEGIYEASPELTFRSLVNVYTLDYRYSVGQPFQGFKVAEAPNYRTLVERYLKFDDESHVNDVQLDATWRKDLGFVSSRFNAGYAYNYTDTDAAPLYTATLPDFVIGQAYKPAVPARSSWAVVSAATVSRNGGWTGYAQESLSAWKGQLVALGGVRYISDDATIQLGKTATVPQIGAVYKFMPVMSLYGSYAESYTPLVGVDLIGRPLVDTTGKSKEVGLKVDALNEHLFGTVTYFDILNDPVLTPGQVVNPATGLLVTGNVQTGKQTNKGWEFDAGWVQPIGRDNLSIYGTLYAANPLSDLHVQPVLAAKKKESIFGKYSVGSGSLKGLYFGAGLVATGASPGVGFPEQPANTQYNAMLGYLWSRWRITCNGDNLSDKRVIVGSSAVFSANVARPRTVKVVISRTW